ncbi:MAG: alpha/beta hydrolase, partial [Ketobacteraceae bacterium]|nr:alpha/beta hydrolase [Ketobacteraceae bacterium]
KALYEDSLTIHDTLLERGVNPDQVVLLGRSLGSAPATYLAAHRPVAKVILVTPFDSLENLASAMFPLLPVKWILNHPFPSLSWAPDIEVPLLMLVAARDEVIPTTHSEKLFNAWGGQKHWQLLQGVGHNDIQMHPDFYPAIRHFLAEGPEGDK